MFPPFHFSPTVSFLFPSLHLPHIFIFSLTLQLLLSLYRSFYPFSLPFTIWLLLFHILSFFLKLSPSLSFLISSMAPKSKKTSYMLSSDAFNLTAWSGVVRLMEPLPIYRLEDHLSANARNRLVSFSFFFSHFQVSLWSSILIFFLDF